MEGMEPISSHADGLEGATRKYCLGRTSLLQEALRKSDWSEAEADGSVSILTADREEEAALWARIQSGERELFTN